MAHWRDGGIGNMAGSDDRPWSEFTLSEKLTVLAGHSKAHCAPFSLLHVGRDAQAIAAEAHDEIERLRADLDAARERTD